ncbi:carboxypeptidase regulatory-like domain-containing protein [Ditylenchus destructor]|nr:carboxypeptidase regulatory-like domain-containing protein [Ditylenchus destructor]
MRAKRSSIVIGVLALVTAVAVVASPASAATTTQWATWQPLTGTSGAYSTSVQITPDPSMVAIVTSTSRSGQVGVISGASTWHSQGTPVGAKPTPPPDRRRRRTPSSTRHPPQAGPSCSVTSTPTPCASGPPRPPNGQALTADELGFRGGFNYCAPGVVGKPSCTGSATDVPTWDDTTLTLTGNAGAVDTSGAAAWFEPSAPITTLSFVFTRRSGLPVYQTWFASLARDVSGTVVDDADAPQADVDLILTDANGRVVASTTTGADGTYSFPGIQGSGGYTVRVSAPEGMIAEGPSTRPVDLSETDAVGVDFVVRDIVPVAVSGRVVDENGNGVGGVTVVVDGTELTAITESDGRYLFDTVPVGDHVVRVIPPGGFSTADDSRSISVPEDSEEPITIPPEDDFVLLTNADLSGVVTSPASGLGVTGAVVTVTDPDGNIVATTVTRPLGGYTIPRLPPGEYTVTITPPTGYAPLGPISATVALGSESLTDINFELALLGSFAGTVRDESGAPIAGVTLTLTGPGGTQQVVSAEDGTYGLGGLAPGDYLLTVVPPEGTQAVDFAQRYFGFPPQGGGTFTAQDFVLAATFAWAASGAVVLLLGATLLIVSRRRARGRDEGPDSTVFGVLKQFSPELGTPGRVHQPEQLAQDRHIRRETPRILGVRAPVPFVRGAPVLERAGALTLGVGVRGLDLVEGDDADARRLDHRVRCSGAVEDDAQLALDGERIACCFVVPDR